MCYSELSVFSGTGYSTVSTLRRASFRNWRTSPALSSSSVLLYLAYFSSSMQAVMFTRPWFRSSFSELRRLSTVGRQASSLARRVFRLEVICRNSMSALAPASIFVCRGCTAEPICPLIVASSSRRVLRAESCVCRLLKITSYDALESGAEKLYLLTQRLLSQTVISALKPVVSFWTNARLFSKLSSEIALSQLDSRSAFSSACVASSSASSAASRSASSASRVALRSMAPLRAVEYCSYCS